MFFKNLTAFKITSINMDIFSESLAKMAFIPCSNIQKNTRGFVSPFRKSDDCLFKVNDLYAFCLMNEEKILPAQVVNQESQEYIDELSQTRSVSSKEKAEIKEDTALRLLPQAFSKFRKTYGYIDIGNNYLVIDSVSEKQINDIVELFIRCEMAIEPIMREESDILTEWFVNSSNPDIVEIADKCKITSDNGDGVAKISCQGTSMLSENIRSFIDVGGHITELATIWNQELSLTLNTKLQFKGIKFLEIESASNKDESSDESDLILAANTFSDLIKSRESWLAEYKTSTES